jgi:hypothetical protein
MEAQSLRPSCRVASVREEGRALRDCEKVVSRPGLDHGFPASPFRGIQ